MFKYVPSIVVVISMEFMDIVAGRYATKKFDSQAVDEGKVSQLKEMIRLAPSSFNIQPWKIKIITDHALKEKLKPLSFDQEQITTCSHLLVFCANTDVSNLIDKLEKKIGKSQYIDMIRGFVSSMSEEQKLAWTKNQVYLALGNALNGAKALGLDSCPMEGFDSKAYFDLLQLEKTVVPTVLCAVGYAADKPRDKFRFPEEDIFF